MANKRLPLSGLGLLQTVTHPAQLDIGNRQLLPPVATIAFSADTATALTEDMMEWLTARTGQSTRQVTQQYQGFIDELLSSLQKNKLVEWKGWGAWSQTDQGVISFTASPTPLAAAPVPAEKIIRQDAEHQIRVGEDSRSSEEMARMLSKKKKNYPFESWIMWSWLIAVSLYLGWQLYTRQFKADSFADPSLIKTTDAPKSYREF